MSIINTKSLNYIYNTLNLRMDLLRDCMGEKWVDDEIIDLQLSLREIAEYRRLIMSNKGVK